MTNYTGTSPINRIHNGSNYGLYAFNTTADPKTYANFITYNFIEANIPMFFEENIFVSARDYNFMLDKIINTTEPHKEIVDLFNSFK